MQPGPEVIDEEERVRRASVLQAAYRSFFSTPHGKLVLRDLMDVGHFWETTFPPDGNPSNLARLEGERGIVLHIISMAHYDLSALLAIARGQPIMGEED